MEIKICPQCGKQNFADAWNCHTCGTTLSVSTLTEIDAKYLTDIPQIRDDSNSTPLRKESAVKSRIRESLNNTLLKNEPVVDEKMEEKTYTINKPKPIPSTIFISLVSVGCIALGFEIGIGFIPSLLSIIFGAGMIYVAFLAVMKAKLTVNQYGIDVIGLHNFSRRQNLSWSDIEWVQVNRNPNTSELFLAIKKTTSGLPIAIPEKWVEDFNDLSNRTVKYYDRSQKKVTQKSMQQRISELRASHAFEDDIAVIRIYCQYLAQEWWQGNSLESAICDSCNGGICRGDGVLVGQNLYCGECADEKFGPSYTHYFSTDRNFYGRGIQEKAWEFVTEYAAGMKET